MTDIPAAMVKVLVGLKGKNCNIEVDLVRTGDGVLAICQTIACTHSCRLLFWSDVVSDLGDSK
jgi:hypothetical protein